MNLVIGILSAHPASFAKRRASIRSSWAARAASLGLDYFFVMGSPPQAPKPLALQSDELVLGCPDDYGSLSLKTRSFFRYALSAFPAARYIMKCDDDTLVYPERLLDLANHLVNKPVPPNYVGGPPNPGNHWASGGAGYLLFRKAAGIIAEADMPAEWCEDLCVGDILRSHHISLYEDQRFHAWPNRYPNQDNDLITSHYVRPENMGRLFEMRLEPDPELA